LRFATFEIAVKGVYGKWGRTTLTIPRALCSPPREAFEKSLGDNLRVTKVRKRQAMVRGDIKPKTDSAEAGYDPSLPLEQWMSYRFGQIFSRVGKFTADMYRTRHQLSQPAWRSLAVIARFEPLSAKELAGRTSSDPFKVARALDALTTQGLIARDADPSDRRKARLKLTKKGWSVYRDVERMSHRLERYFREALKPDDIKRLDRTLDTLDARVTELMDRFKWQDFADD
jgi:DNA-binding MarR family transcriptional regulator